MTSNTGMNNSTELSWLAIWRQSSVFLLPLRDVLLIFIYSGLFLIIFLLLFKPFGLEASSFNDRLAVTTAVAIVNAAIGIGLYLGGQKALSLRSFSPAYYFKAEICYLLCLTLLVGGLIFMLQVVMGAVSPTWHNAFLFQCFAFSLAPMLVLGVRVLLNNRHLHRQLALHWAQSEQASGTKKQLITLIEVENQPPFVFDFNEWQYAKAQGNYVELYLLCANKPLTILLRLSLKSLLAALANQETCEHCHRSYAINLDKISQVSRYGQSYKVHFGQAFDAVPIARNRVKAFKVQASTFLAPGIRIP